MAINFILFLGILIVLAVFLCFMFICWYFYRIIIRWFHDMLQCVNTIVKDTNKISEKIDRIEERVSFIENYYSNYSDEAIREQTEQVSETSDQ